MRVLVGCEFSGVVREAFRARGHDAYSCDLLPAEDASLFHIQGDVLDYLDRDWDLAIFHPPCTYLARSGARWWPDREDEQRQALTFVDNLFRSGIPRIAIENPIGKVGTWFRKPDQIIQPWQFGHGETKATALWLHSLPLLRPTCIVDGRTPRVFHAQPGPERWKERARTLSGIAAAMATQWDPANIEQGELFA